MRLVDDERHAARLALRRRARHVGEHAVVGWRHEEDGGDRPRRGAADRGAHLGAGTPTLSPLAASYAGGSQTGAAPDAISAATADRCALRGSSTAGAATPRCRASCTHASTAAITPAVEPLTRYHVRAAPNASAASACARAIGPSAAKSPSISGSSGRSYCSGRVPEVVVFVGRAACKAPILWPKKKGAADGVGGLDEGVLGGASEVAPVAAELALLAQRSSG